MSYYFSKTGNDSFDETVAKLNVELKEKVFDILTEIDVKLLPNFEHKGPVFFISIQDMAQQPVPQKIQRAHRNVAIPAGISFLQIRNLRDEEFMLLFLILKSGVPNDLKPVFFFGKMVTAVLI